MESVVKDVLFAFRSLKRQPAFAITAVLTIALGIGATSAIFSVVNAVLLRPLPYNDATRLGTIWSDLRNRNVVDFPLPPGDFFDLRKDTTLFDGFGAITSFRPTVGGDGQGEAEQVSGGAVTPNFFRLLGHRIQHGRDFNEDDATPNPAPPQGDAVPAPGVQPPPPLPNIAIISHEFFQRRFGGNASIVGQSIPFGANGRADIVGVLTPGFELLFPPGTGVDPRPDILVAARVDYEAGSRNNVSLRVIGKLKPGVSFEQAQSELDRLSADLRSRFPIKQTSNMNLRIEPMHDDLVADVRTQLVALMGAVVFVLLIACANVANLLLVRASARERELAVRAAIGGNRWRIVRQLIAESVVLAAIGGAAGLLLAQFGIDALIQLAPEGLPRATAVSLDGTVLAFTAIASFAAALIFGVLPAWKASRPDVMDVLRSSRGAVGSGSRWLRDGAVIAEVALAFVLLVGSGLMIRTFIALQNVNPGFDPNNTFTFLIQNNRAQGVEGRQAFQRDMLERLKAVPGVIDATSAGPIPLDGGNSLARFGPLEASTDPAKFQQAIAYFVQPNFFSFAKTPIVAGRGFTDADNRPEARVVVIDELIAAQLFPNGNAIGQRMLARVTTPEPVQFEVIGVARHQRHTTMMNDGEEGMYFPDGYSGFGAAFRWAVRTSGDPDAIVNAVRSALAEQDRRLLLTEPRTWKSYVDEQLAPTRFALILIGVFAAVAAILAMIGLYGVLATTVRQRTTEIGVRMAFGATRGSIVSLIIGQGLRLSAGGIVLGVIAAIALTRVMASLLVGVSATDPITFASMAVLFAAIATFAAWIPAQRAAGLNPNVALRDE